MYGISYGMILCVFYCMILSVTITHFKKMLSKFTPAGWPPSCLNKRWGNEHYSCSGYIHYNDVIMSAMAAQITSLTIVYSIVYSDADQRIHQSSASLAFVRGIHRSPVNSPHKGPVTRKMFPFDDVIMYNCIGLVEFMRDPNFMTTAWQMA